MSRRFQKPQNYVKPIPRVEDFFNTQWSKTFPDNLPSTGLFYLSELGKIKEFYNLHPEFEYMKNYNACISQNDDKTSYILLARLSSCFVEKKRRLFQIHWHTLVNKISEISLDKNLEILSKKLLDVPCPHNMLEMDWENKIIEDCKMYKDTKIDIIYGTGCSWNDPEHHSWGNKIVVFDRKNNKSICLKSPLDQNREKNWIAYKPENDFLFIYSFFPFILVKPNFENGECEIFKHDKKDFRKPFISGGTNYIEFEDCYLFLVHDYLSDNPFPQHNTYRHYFVLIKKDNPYEIFKITKEFGLLNTGLSRLEFAMGMCWSLDQTKVLISFGSDDATTNILEIEKDVLKKFLDF